MKNSTTMPPWGQLVVGGTVLTIAIAAGATSLTINIVHHLKTDIISAVAFGLADIGKLAVPVIAAAIGWSSQLRSTLIVCALASMASVSLHLYDTHGQALFARDAQAQTYAGVQDDIKRARTELASITETGTAEDLDRSAMLAQDRAAAEEKRGGCGRGCIAAQAEAASYAERAGKARRKALLEEKLAKAKTEASATDAVQETGEARKWVTAGMAALGLLLLETLVYLSIPGAGLIARALGNAKPKPNTRSLRPATAEAPQHPAQKRSPGRPGIMTREEAYAVLQGHAARTGGSFFATKADIAEKLSEGKTKKLSPNTLTPWIKYWADHDMMTMRKVSNKDISYIFHNKNHKAA